MLGWSPLIFLLLLFFLVLEFVLRSLEKRRRLEEMLGISSPSMARRLVMVVRSSATGDRILTRMSLAMAFFDLKYRQSMEETVMLLFMFLTVLSLGLALLLWLLGMSWQKAAISLLLACIASGFFIYFLYLWGKERFARSLPQIYRLLSSRYLVSGDMTQAIRELLPNVKGGVLRLFESILEAMLSNDMDKRDERFSLMMDTVDQEYFSLLLYIIRQASEKGGQDVIFRQFIDLTEECLTELQWRKNLRAVARSYRLLFLVLGLLFFASPHINEMLLWQGSQGFYDSPIYYFFSFLYVLMSLSAWFSLTLLERNV